MNYRVIEGDCLASLQRLPNNCTNTCVTSPPYFGLRDYGVKGQIGLEETPDAYVNKLVNVFREVRRVLRDDGTLWLNLGDSYAASQSNNGGCSPKSTLAGGGGKYREGSKNKAAYDSTKPRRLYHGLKHKDLIGIPWRVALALQADGWYLRQDIIWHKPNPMPESVRDRCTKAHEYIFLLSKSPKYYFDIEPIREPVKPTSGKINGAPLRGDHVLREGGRKTERREYAEIKGANRRSVWTVTTKPFKGAHFATFPPDLIEPCVLAGCPVGGVVLDPFAGSGTTLQVAVKNGRYGLGLELNPDYIKLIHERMEKINGTV